MCGARPVSRAASRSPASWLIRRPDTGAFQNIGIHDMHCRTRGRGAAPQFYADAAVDCLSQARRATCPVESTACQRSPPAAAAPDARCSPMAISRRPPSCRFPRRAKRLDPVRIRRTADHSRRHHRHQGRGAMIEALIAGIANPEKICRSERRRAELSRDCQAPGGGAPAAYRLLPAGDGKVFPRDLQAHPAAARRPPGRAASISLPSASNRPASHRLRDRRAGAASRRARQSLRREGRVHARCPTSTSSPRRTSIPPTPVAKIRRHRPDLQDASGRHARLDSAAGNWVVLRFGYSLLGITNHPAPRKPPASKWTS